jgi:PHD/YefM family antitoxin component YafN of YafNO toxin-antitoxin module
MINEEILSLTEWKRDTTRALKRLKGTHDAQVLTVNGRAEAVVVDPAEYQRLREAARVEYMRTAVQEALVAHERGAPTYPADEVFARLRARAEARLKANAAKRPKRR